jgi:hypothetical protein
VERLLPFGQGVSIAFEPAALAAGARQASFMMGRCIYDHERQMAVAGQVLDYIVDQGTRSASAKPAVPHQSHYGLFQDIEPAFLQIAVLMKNGAFQEEQEWRLVSPVHNNYVEPPILYREGAFSLVPYPGCASGQRRRGARHTPHDHRTVSKRQSLPGCGQPLSLEGRGKAKRSGE